VVYLLRGDGIGLDGRLLGTAPLEASVALPGMEPGRYRATAWDTRAGRIAAARELVHRGGALQVGRVRVATDLTLAIRRMADV
jgi:hypothetical protein